MRKRLIAPMVCAALRRSAVTIALVLGLGGQAWANSPTEQLRVYTDQVMKVLESRTMTPPERLEAVRAVASEAFDVSETAQRALGLHWQQRTPAEKQEFVQVFRPIAGSSTTSSSRTSASSRATAPSSTA